MPISQHSNYPTVSKELIDALEVSISQARLRPYLEAAGFNKERAIKLYLWNVMLGQSFHFPLQAFEVSLRNAISRIYVAHYGKKWWRASIARSFLDEWAVDELTTARRRLRNKGITATPDEMVARLSFGFWTAALAPKYKPQIWSRHLSAVFPHAPNGMTQDAIYAKANNALDLRNRIFHHDPLIGLNVLGNYSEIMQLLKWICPETQLWVKSHCSIPTLVRSKP
jgi:hypothetical protein